MMGGLGNQMFQFALGKSLEKKIQEKVVFDIEFYKKTLRNTTPRNLEINELNTCFVTASGLQSIGLNIIARRYFKVFFNKIIYNEKKPFGYDKTVFHQSGLKIFLGYWQSYKYFEDIRDLLLLQFTPKEPFPEDVFSILEKVERTNSVAIHVRRGDYVSNPYSNAFHGIQGLEYLQNAKKIIESNRKNPRYFIFSDDLEWCQREIPQIFGPSELTFLDYRSRKSFYDIYIMSKCKDFIISNSSFSWWAAWLGQNENKIVVVPENWTNFHKSRKLEDFIPIDWKIA